MTEAIEKKIEDMRASYEITYIALYDGDEDIEKTVKKAGAKFEQQLKELVELVEKEKDIFKAYKIVRKFDSQSAFDIDWTKHFEGTKDEIDKMVKDFVFTGLANSDLLFCDFYTRYKVKLKQ